MHAKDCKQNGGDLKEGCRLVYLNFNEFLTKLVFAYCIIFMEEYS